MGDVYAALDLKSDPPREVALKTIRDVTNPSAVELFRRECSVLMSFTHPNVIELYETGDFDDRGVVKPFFVMARLRGVTLAQLIKDSPQNLTVQRTIDIICQVCRGLQAAHERDLVHRDIKPSNIFVLEDDSVKVIDFGVAHLMSAETIGAKGTLHYMAPEQFEGKPVTPATDVFSLGVVCFEALTRRRPFDGSTSDEIRAGIMKQIPPPASSLNPAVNVALSQVIHAAMAKRPLHRFSSAREFGDCLRKALRNEPIERFEPGKLQLRLARVQRALEDSQYEIASEILGQLEEEGYLHPSINELRRQVDQALRNRDIRQFLDTARSFVAQEEYSLALQKVQDALQLESTNSVALELRSEIQAKRSSQQIGNWLNLAQKHLSNCAFEPAREAVSSVLRMLPTDVTALRLMSEINRVEQEVVRKRQEKERHFDSAVEFRKKGDLTAALSRLERVLELDREAPDAVQPERGAAFQTFYNEVRSEHESIKSALEQAKQELESKNYAAADAICEDFLAKYPNHALFQALKYDVGERQRQDLSAYIAEVDRETEAEVDLDRKAKILQVACARYPDELHFERALKGVNARRDLINGLVGQARNLEDRGQYSEALDKWETLRSIYKQYPGLDIEVDRIRKRLQQQARAEAKARWIERIDSAINGGEYTRALTLVQQALVESPNDPQLAPLERLARQRAELSKRAQSLLDVGQKLLEEKSNDEALKALEEAYNLDEHNALTRAVYIEALLTKASSLIDTNVETAERLIETAFGLDATNPRVKSMRVLALDRKRTNAVDQYLLRAREHQAADQVEQAFAEVEKGLAAYPGDVSLIQLQRSLEGSQKQSELRRDREQMLKLRRRLELSNDDSLLKSVFDESAVIVQRHPTDEQIQVIANEIGTMVRRRSPEPARVAAADDVLTVVEQVEKLPTTPVSSHTAVLKRVPRLYRNVGAMVILAVTTVVIIALLLKPRPLPSFNKIGTAVSRTALALHKDQIESSKVVGNIDALQAIELGNELPPLPLKPGEWTLVRSQADHRLYGYVRIGDLKEVETDDVQFELRHALMLIAGAKDPADRRRHLDALDRTLQAKGMPVGREFGEIYLVVSEDYAMVAEQNRNDTAVATAALSNAEQYFNRIDGVLQLSDRGQGLQAHLQSIKEMLKPPEPPVVSQQQPQQPSPVVSPPPPAPPPGPRMSGQLNAAKKAYDRAQKELDATKKKELYRSVIESCDSVLESRTTTPQERELQNQAAALQSKARSELEALIRR